jgi:hypothetical protein
MDSILDTDNGLIAAALKVYINEATNGGSPQDLIDRANDLYFIFMNKSPTESYDLPDDLLRN